MPRIAKKDAESIDTVSKIQQFNEDGHPNPDFFRNDDRGLEEFQAVLDERDLWNEYIGYLYRVAPRRTQTDKPTRVTTFVQTLTIPEITKRYGGKKWTVIMNRTIGQTRKTRTVKSFQFDIEAPAIWQDEETPEQPGSGSRSQAQAPEGVKADPLITKFVDDLIVQRDQALAQGQAFDTGEALQRALALQNKGFESALTSVTANIGKGDNATITAVITSLTTLVSDLIKSNATRKDDPIMQALVNRAMEKPPDVLQQVLALATMLKELGVKIGGVRAAEPGSEWAGVVEKLVDKGPELLNGATQLVVRAGSLRGTPAPPARPAIAPVVPQLIRAPSESERVSGPNLPPESSTSQVSETATPPPVAVPPEVADMIAQNVVKTAIVRMLYAGDTGDDAAHYAEMAHEPLARRLAEVLKTSPAELQQDPILRQAMTHANIMTFAKDFVDYFEEGTESPPEGSPEPRP